MEKRKLLTTRSIVLCGLFAALIAVGAFIKIPTPIVPLTLQVMFVCLAGLLLGSKLGGISALVYMILGLVGIPIFTGGGGIGYVLKPTFGYIIGFVVGAYVTGYIIEKASKLSLLNILLASFAGLLVIYIIGVLYLYCILNFYVKVPSSLWSVIYKGMIVCIPGDVITCFIGSIIAKRVRPMLLKGN